MQLRLFVSYQGKYYDGSVPCKGKDYRFSTCKTTRFLDPAKYVTLNKPLQDVGYHTGIIGKWHLDTDFKNNIVGPDKHGFNEVIRTETKYIADGDYFYPYNKINTYSSGKEGEYLTDRQCADAVDFVSRNKKAPFFLYLSFYSVHTALAAPENIVSKYKKKYDLIYGAGASDKIFGPENLKNVSDKPHIPCVATMLKQIDKGVGSLMDKLDKEGIAKNTLVIFFSDNGSAKGTGNNGSFREGKTWLYEGGISLMTGGIEPKRDALYWHNPSETGKAPNKMSSVIRKGDFKLLQFYKGNRLELYDLKSDPGERKNLAQLKPAKRDELLKILEKWKKDVDAEAPDLTGGKKVAGQQRKVNLKINSINTVR